MSSLFKQRGQQGQAEGSANAESQISEQGFGAMHAEPNYVDNPREQINRERQLRSMFGGATLR